MYYIIVRRKQFQEESEKQVTSAVAGSKHLSLQERAKLLQNLDKQFASELKEYDKTIVQEMDKRLLDQQVGINDTQIM